MIMKPEIKERRIKRLASMRECKTPLDLSFNIWTAASESVIGNRSHYRTPFIEWVESYSKRELPKQWTSYTTSQELAEGIWEPYLDREDDYGLFQDLRDTLVQWIEDYKSKCESVNG